MLVKSVQFAVATHIMAAPYGIESVCLRLFNVYGPGEDHKGRFASMIHQLARQMRAGNRPRIFTAAPRRVIQSWRKCRFFWRRSR